MTTAGPPDRLDVPVERLPVGRGQARRATAVAVGIVAVLGAAFGIARWSETRIAAMASAPPAEVSLASSPPTPTRPPLATMERGGRRIERLVEADRVALPGAPEVTLIERTGDGQHDLRIVVWTPDDARTRVIRRIPHVLPGGADPVLPLVAPNRRHVLLFGVDPSGGLGKDTGWLIDDAGTNLWTGDHLAAASGGLWRADSRLLVVTGQPRLWHLIGVDEPGHATETTVTLPGDVYLPYPIPRGWATVSALEPRTIPLGFSADGRWIYGGVISPELGILIDEFRVRDDGSAVEKLTDLRVGHRDGLAPRPGTQGVRFVDPVTGRVMTSRINADTTGGPRTVEVRGPDAGFLFAVEGGVTLGAEWGADGGLYALTADALLYPAEVALRRLDESGRSGPPLLTAGPLTGAALIGIRDEYAVIGLLATRPDQAAQLVVVDLVRPERLAALPLDADRELIAASLDR